MNEIELRNRVDAIEARKKELMTPRGQKIAEKEMVNILGVFTAYGYKLPEGQDIKQMATVWRYALMDFISIYGMETIKKAAVEFVRNDSREYHPFPVVGDIIKEIKKAGINPIAELKRRELEAMIKREDDIMTAIAEEWVRRNNGN